MDTTVRLSDKASTKLVTICRWFRVDPGRFVADAAWDFGGLLKCMRDHQGVPAMVKKRPEGVLVSPLHLKSLEDFRRAPEARVLLGKPGSGDSITDLGGAAVPATIIGLTLDDKRLALVNELVGAATLDEAYAYCLWAYFSLMLTAAEMEGELAVHLPGTNKIFRLGKNP